jgi:hypothetical protein
MLTWAYSNSHESGFAAPAPWWPQIEAPQPSTEEIEKMRSDAEKLRSRKTGFRVQHVGDLLARHEDFCAGKVAEEKISPGIRWGISRFTPFVRLQRTSSKTIRGCRRLRPRHSWATRQRSTIKILRQDRRQPKDSTA